MGWPPLPPNGQDGIGPEGEGVPTESTSRNERPQDRAFDAIPSLKLQRLGGSSRAPNRTGHPKEAG